MCWCVCACRLVSFVVFCFVYLGRPGEAAGATAVEGKRPGLQALGECCIVVISCLALLDSRLSVSVACYLLSCCVVFWWEHQSFLTMWFHWTSRCNIGRLGFCLSFGSASGSVLPGYIALKTSGKEIRGGYVTVDLCAFGHFQLNSGNTYIHAY